MPLDPLLSRVAAAANGLVAPHQATIRKAGSFALVGVINTLVDFAVFLLGYQLIGLPLVPANVLAWLVAVSGSYTLNSRVTFVAESGGRLSIHSYLTFVASGLVGLVANTATLVLASQVMPVLFAKVIAIGVSFAVNFALSHFVVFRRKQD